MLFQNQRNITHAFNLLSSCELKVPQITAYFKQFLFWKFKCQCNSPGGDFCCAAPGWGWNGTSPSFHTVISSLPLIGFVSSCFNHSIWISAGSYSLTFCFEHSLEWGTAMAFIQHFYALLSPGSPISFPLRCRVIWLHLSPPAVHNTAT